ncbi:MAG TPA: glycine oxidase ThiO [Solirubrobacteraceae bacterium]|nr:glycine oxidase ThiO [Solirubrobacteraceae bacterium]
MAEHIPAADVAVVGGGVIGLSIAWRAAQRGMKVCVLERDQAGWGTSRQAAGMLAPVAEVTPAEEPLLELGLRSARAYPGFVAELVQAAGERSVGYTPCGTLLVARDADEAEALERELALRARLGLAVRRLRASEARALEPALAPTLRLALHVPDDHAVDPRALTQALAAALRRRGGELREGCRVAALETAGGAVRGLVLSDGTTVAAHQVVIAAGTWCGEIGGIPERDRVPVAPIKGQIMRLHDPAGPGLLSRVTRMGSSYITPRGDGRYVIGGTSEERGFDTTVTAGAVHELLRDATELVPGVSELVLDELSAGLRPGTPDNLPAIGPAALAGLHWAAGHRRNGILLAPVTAEIVAAALAGDGVGWDIAPFAPTRFASRRNAADGARDAAAGRQEAVARSREAVAGAREAVAE